MCCVRLAANTGCKKSPSGHHPTTSLGYIFATKSRIDNRKKNLLSSNMSSTCPHNMVNFGPLAAEICWRVWDTPANFNGFRVLAALLHGIPVLGVSQTFRRWTEGATYIRQGGHHVGQWPTFLVTISGCMVSQLTKWTPVVDTNTVTRLAGQRHTETVVHTERFWSLSTEETKPNNSGQAPINRNTL